MPAQWTGEVIGKMHMNHITGTQLARHLGYHPKYVSAVLNGRREPKNAENVFRQAVEEITVQRSDRPKR